MGAENAMLYYDFSDSLEELFVPLYEYQCAKCGHRFEKIESVNAPEKKKCPKCGARAGRMQSAPAIQFKGSGWYATDYGGKSTSGGSMEGKSSGDGKSSSEGKGSSDGKKAESSSDSGKAAPAKETATAKKKDKD